MTPKVRLILAGAAFLVVALFSFFGLATAYWPFQSVVQVTAPFIVLSVLVSVGTTLILAAFLLPEETRSLSASTDPTLVIDTLLDETRRPR